MYCTSCGKQIDNDSSFCFSCGKSLSNSKSYDCESNYNEKNKEEKNINELNNFFSNVADQITKIAGVDKPEDLKLRDVFSDVFKKHADKDAERLFIMGTDLTTPNIEDSLDAWPKPWLFARIFIIMMTCYLGLFIILDIFQNELAISGLIFMGTFAVPVTLLVFFWEMNTPQNVSFYQIIKVFFVGGVISLVITNILYSFFGAGVPVIVGVVEETAKLLPIIWIIKKGKNNYILNGLLIGAAIGAGFAAFESSGYAILQNGYQELYQNIFLRGVLTPGTHVAWAALSGAALCRVKGNKQFRWDMLIDIRFLRIFLLVVAMHAVWDIQMIVDIPVYIMSIPVHMIILTLISWVIIFSMLSAGLKEITVFKNGK